MSIYGGLTLLMLLLEHMTELQLNFEDSMLTLIFLLATSLHRTLFLPGENTISTLGRLVLIVWLFVVLIITSSYTTSLTSILTVKQLTSSITGIESLITSQDHIGYQVGSFAENYLIDELNIAKSRLIPLGSPQAYADALKRGIVAAVVDEQPYVSAFHSKYCGFQMIGQQFTKSGLGFI